jgi:UrcA family protein
MKLFAILALMGALQLSSTSIGVAEAGDGVSSTKVQYGDLDLTRDSGLASLYGRVARAAHTVCRALDPSESANSSFRLMLKSQHEACMLQAIEGAAVKIDSGSFSAFTAAKLAGASRPKSTVLASK